MSGATLNPADYTLSLAEDKQSVTLEFSQAFLAAHDMGGDISVTLALFEPTTGRNFPPYTLSLKANTPPPVPQGGCIMADASNHYVVCFNLDLGTIHGDLQYISINGYTTTVTSSVGPASLSFANPSFKTNATSLGTLNTLGTRPAFTAGSGTIVPVYLSTNETVNAYNNEYRITITDTAGFATSYSLWTLSDFLGPVKVTNVSGVELANDSGIDQDGGKTTGTVLIKAPTTTDQGTPVTGVTVYYGVYLDPGYTVTYYSGNFTGTETAVSIPPVQVYIKAWAQKNGYTDSVTKELSVRAKAVRLSVNETNISGPFLGTDASPIASIPAAISSLDAMNNSDNTIYLLADLTSSVTINTNGLSLTIEGNNHRIDAGGLSRCLELSAGNVTIKNLTIMNGKVNGGSGSGVFVRNPESMLMLDNCIITGNIIELNSNVKGAGVAIQNGATVTMQGCTVSSNQFLPNTGTSFGGGISLEGNTVPTRLTMVSCDVKDNIAGKSSSSYGSGGGIYATGTQAFLSITNSSISNNIAAKQYSGIGGGLAITGGASVVMDSVTITGNKATESGNISHTGDGGGIYIAGSSLTINNTLAVTGNYASFGSAIGSGGGIFVNASILTNNGNIVVQNNLGSQGYEGKGGGLYLASNAGLNLTSVTITRNTASATYNGKGGGIYIDSGTQLILNSTIDSNKASDGTTPSVIGYGGGLYISSTTDTRIMNSSISSNQSAKAGIGWGGGVFNLGGSGIVISLGSVLQNNVATASTTQPGYGGGVATGSGSFNIADTLIQANLANQNANGSGGGIFFGDGNYSISGDTVIKNNVGTQGAGTGMGGGVYIDTNASVVFSGGLITGNLARSGGSGLGNGIWAGKTFTMQGSSSAAASPSDNDVFLYYSGNTYIRININSTLTAPIVAVLTPDSWHTGQLLFGGTNYLANISKFSVSSTSFRIDSSGILQNNP